MAKIPEVSGIMIVGSGATLFSENTTMHHASDFDIIPITTSDFSDDPLERSIIADKVRDAFATELQNNGIQIKLDIFYPAISSAKSELVSQAMSISRELSNTPFHIVQKGK